MSQHLIEEIRRVKANTNKNVKKTVNDKCLSNDLDYFYKHQNKPPNTQAFKHHATV